MRKQLIMYVIIDKNTDNVTINKYLNSDIPYILGMNLRKVQRVFAEKDKVETERYIIYKVYNIDLGNRGGLRERKRSDDW